MKHFIIFIACFCLCLKGQEDQRKQKTIIIFFNVLFRPDEKEIEKHVRSSLSLLRSIGLLFSGIPKKDEIKHQLFSILHTIPLLTTIVTKPDRWKSDYTPWDIDYQYPPILNQMITSSSHEEEQKIYDHVVSVIKYYPHLSKTHKIIITCIADFLFQSRRMNRALQPINDLVHLLQKLQREGHRLILIAGAPGYAWDAFKRDEPQARILHELFPTGYHYVSGKEHLLPTSPQIFEKIMRDHNLNPCDCMVIAHNYHDLAYAQQLGMHTCIFHPTKTRLAPFSSELEKFLHTL